VQACPQAPQLLTSLVTSTQPYPQSWVPLGHWQVLATQTWAWTPSPGLAAEQVLPQAPQLAALVVESTHWLEQTTSPPGHVELHDPSTQASLAPHVTPQPPQFLGSECGSMQLRLHTIWPAVGHVEVHAAFTQSCVLLHAIPQPPQLLTSLLPSTHCPPQLIWSSGGPRLGQTHCPAPQAWPMLHE